MIEYLPYAVVGLIGLFLHTASKVKSKKISAVFTYIGSESKAMFTSLLTLAIFFWAWVENPDLAVYLGLTSTPSIIVMFIMGYSIDSIALKVLKEKEEPPEKE